MERTSHIRAKSSRANSYSSQSGLRSGYQDIAAQHARQQRWQWWTRSGTNPIDEVALREKNLCTCYLIVLVFLLVLTTLGVALPLTLPKSNSKQAALQNFTWANITGFPSIVTGQLAINRLDLQSNVSGCTSPSYIWSCAIPKELQNSSAAVSPYQPNLILDINYANSSTSTSPDPQPPLLADQSFLGNTTDSNTAPFEGESTPFTISILDPTTFHTTKKKRQTPDNGSRFIPLQDIIPGVPAPAANLLLFPTAQPLRIYNRNRTDEHYGFYAYFDRSIFTTSIGDAGDILNQNTLNQGGGSSLQNARYRCTCAQTRFLVQIWTKRNGSTPLARQIVNETGVGEASFARIGLFPYPITITLDRHGGDPGTKMLYCYGVASTGTVNTTSENYCSKIVLLAAV